MDLTPTDLVIGMFRAAGWSSEPSHRFDRSLHPAVHVLRQFGGLHIVPPDSDGVVVPSDIQFGNLAELGSLGDRSLESIEPKSGWSNLLGTPLVRIAEYHHSHGAIMLAGDGRIFVRSLIHDAMGFQADDFAVGVEQILLGSRQSTPMIRPDQSSVSWYGVNYTHGDAELYRYA